MSSRIASLASSLVPSAIANSLSSHGSSSAAANQGGAAVATNYNATAATVGTAQSVTRRLAAAVKNEEDVVASLDPRFFTPDFDAVLFALETAPISLEIAPLIADADPDAPPSTLSPRAREAAAARDGAPDPFASDIALETQLAGLEAKSAAVGSQLSRKVLDNYAGFIDGLHHVGAIHRRLSQAAKEAADARAHLRCAQEKVTARALLTIGTQRARTRALALLALGRKATQAAAYEAAVLTALKRLDFGGAAGLLRSIDTHILSQPTLGVLQQIHCMRGPLARLQSLPAALSSVLGAELTSLAVTFDPPRFVALTRALVSQARAGALSRDADKAADAALHDKFRESVYAHLTTETRARFPLTSLDAAGLVGRVPHYSLRASFTAAVALVAGVLMFYHRGAYLLSAMANRYQALADAAEAQAAREAAAAKARAKNKTNDPSSAFFNKNSSSGSKSGANSNTAGSESEGKSGAAGGLPEIPLPSDDAAAADSAGALSVSVTVDPVSPLMSELERETAVLLADLALADLAPAVAAATVAAGSDAQAGSDTSFVATAGAVAAAELHAVAARFTKALAPAWASGQRYLCLYFTQPALAASSAASLRIDDFTSMHIAAFRLMTIAERVTASSVAAGGASVGGAATGAASTAPLARAMLARASVFVDEYARGSREYFRTAFSTDSWQPLPLREGFVPQRDIKDLRPTEAEVTGTPTATARLMRLLAQRATADTGAGADGGAFTLSGMPSPTPTPLVSPVRKRKDGAGTGTGAGAAATPASRALTSPRRSSGDADAANDVDDDDEGDDDDDVVTGRAWELFTRCINPFTAAGAAASEAAAGGSGSATSAAAAAAEAAAEAAAAAAEAAALAPPNAGVADPASSTLPVVAASSAVAVFLATPPRALFNPYARITTLTDRDPEAFFPPANPRTAMAALAKQTTAEAAAAVAAVAPLPVATPKSATATTTALAAARSLGRLISLVRDVPPCAAAGFQAIEDHIYTYIYAVAVTFAGDLGVKALFDIPVRPPRVGAALASQDLWSAFLVHVYPVLAGVLQSVRARFPASMLSSAPPTPSANSGGSSSNSNISISVTGAAGGSGAGGSGQAQQPSPRGSPAFGASSSARPGTTTAADSSNPFSFDLNSSSSSGRAFPSTPASAGSQARTGGAASTGAGATGSGLSSSSSAVGETPSGKSAASAAASQAANAVKNKLNFFKSKLTGKPDAPAAGAGAAAPGGSGGFGGKDGSNLLSPTPMSPGYGNADSSDPAPSPRAGPPAAPADAHPHAHAPPAVAPFVELVLVNLSSPSAFHGVLQRVAAVRTVHFLAFILQTVRPRLHVLLPPAQQDRLALLCAAAEAATLELTQLVFTALPRLLLATHPLRNQVLAVRWDSKAAPQTQNHYVDGLIAAFSIIEGVLETHPSLFPTTFKLALHRGMLDEAIDMLIEAYSAIPKSSHEGRAGMSLDATVLKTGLERVTKIKPVPRWTHVAEYINAFYFDERDFLTWMRRSADAAASSVAPADPSVPPPKLYTRAQYLSVAELGPGAVMKKTQKVLFVNHIQALLDDLEAESSMACATASSTLVTAAQEQQLKRLAMGLPVSVRAAAAAAAAAAAGAAAGAATASELAIPFVLTAAAGVSGSGSSSASSAAAAAAAASASNSRRGSGSGGALAASASAAPRSGTATPSAARTPAFVPLTGASPALAALAGSGNNAVPSAPQSGVLKPRVETVHDMDAFFDSHSPDLGPNVPKAAGANASKLSASSASANASGESAKKPPVSPLDVAISATAASKAATGANGAEWGRRSVDEGFDLDDFLGSPLAQQQLSAQSSSVQSPRSQPDAAAAKGGNPFDDDDDDAESAAKTAAVAVGGNPFDSTDHVDSVATAHEDDMP